MVFRGKTGKINGHVFQVHSDRKNKSQFMETLEALRIYSSTTYKDDIESLTVLFTKLEQPVVKEPEDPLKVIKTVKGVDVETMSKFEEMKFTENVKQWIHDDKSLKATIRSMYYVVMGQCSTLMHLHR